MRIAVDAMGGDHAPDEIVRGALLYRAEGGVAELVLVGREEAVRASLGASPRAGITGATMASAVLILKRIPGIDRPALCGMLPTVKGNPACLIDAGATMDAEPNNLMQYARMAS